MVCSVLRACMVLRCLFGECECECIDTLVGLYTTTLKHTRHGARGSHCFSTHDESSYLGEAAIYYGRHAR